jgi:hypothetical protein
MGFPAFLRIDCVHDTGFISSRFFIFPTVQKEQAMDEKLPYWGSVLLSAVAVILVLVNITFSNSNRTLQQEVSQRQASLTSGQQLAQLNQSLIQALAEAASKNNTQIRDLLSSQGITLKSDAAAAAPAPSPAPKPSDKK